MHMNLLRPTLMPNFFIPDEYAIFPPRHNQNIFDWIHYDGEFGTGVSVVAFKSGLRLPFHPFVEMVLDYFHIGLGKLIPNSFLHINIFISKCKALKIPRNLNVFLNFFRLVANSKYNGFYSTGKIPNTPEWTILHPGVRGHYK